MHQEFLKFAFSYALRSLSRHKRRTFITLATVALSLAISVVSSRYSASIMDLWIEGAADTGTAHAQLHSKGYWQKQEGVDESLTMAFGNEFEKSLARDKDVDAYVRRLKFEGLINTDEKSVYFVGIGVEPVQETKVSPRLFYPGWDEGKFVVPESKQSANIGRGLAKLLDLKLGGDATLVSQTGKGSVNAVDVIVDGIIEVPLPSFSKRVVYLNLTHAQGLIRLPDRYTELAIRLKKGVNQAKWVAKNQKLASSIGAELRGWWHIDEMIKKAENLWDAVAGLLCALLFLSAGLTVLNVIFMTVNERTIEIGTLKALGARSKDVKILLSFEGALIGLIGGIIGIVIGNIIVVIMGTFGVPFESPFGGGYETAYPRIDYYWSLGGIILAVIGCALCAVPPARKAAMVEPVQAFRNQIT